MTRISYLMEKNPSAETGQDLYGFYNDFCEEFDDVSYETYKRYCREAVKRLLMDEVLEADEKDADPSEKVEFLNDEKKNNRTISTKSAKITSLEELLSYSGVDLEEWQVDRHIVNSWEVTIGKAKSGTGKTEIYTNYQVKAWLKRRTDDVVLEKELDSFKREAKSHAPVYKPKVYFHAPEKEENLLELSLFDHHFGQLSLSQETRYPNYDLEVAKDLALDSVNYLLNQYKDYSRILISMGNDFFNVDNKFGTTTSGTPQIEASTWKNTYTMGRKLWVAILEMCMEKAPVDLLVIPGNHDEQRSYYLGDSLECWFHRCSDVNVDNSPTDRKYYTWGNALIGYTHGNKEKRRSLAQIMAVEKPIEWSQSIYREWRKGHLHAAKSTNFQVLDEDYGVREWVMPSLVSVDDWHSGKGYSAMRESIANLWNKDKGKIGMAMYHP